jgi:DNA ligase 1
MSFLKQLFGPGGSHACKEIVLVEHEKARDRQHVLDKLKEIESLGGEGLMLRKSGSFVLSFSTLLVRYVN